MRFRFYGMAVAFALLAWLMSLAQQQSTVRVFGGLGHRAEQMLAYRGVPLNREGRLLRIDSQHETEVVDVLCEVLHINSVAIAVHQQNLSRAQADRPDAEEPYRRQYLVFTEDGGILGLQQDMRDLHWCYEPRHLHSWWHSPKWERTVRSNVDEEHEKNQLMALERERANLRQVLTRLAPDQLMHDPRPDLSRITKLESPPPNSPPNSLEKATMVCHKLLTRAVLESLVLIDSRPAVLSQEANREHTQQYVSDERRSERAAGREDMDKTFENCSRIVALPACEFSSEWLVSQSNCLDSGQASIATALNWIHRDRKYDARAIDEKYGFRLLDALHGEAAPYGLQWRNLGLLNSSLWPEIAHKVNEQKLPVLLTFEGDLSPQRSGYIVAILKFEGGRVTFADSIEGEVRTATKKELLQVEEDYGGHTVLFPQ